MRKYKRKSKRGQTPLNTMKKAANLVRKKCLTARAAASLYGICYVSLNRFIYRMINNYPTDKLMGYMSPRLVFTKEQERTFVKVLREKSKLHPITSWDIRILALQFAGNNSIKVPPSWEQNCLAGEDWLSGFYRRNDHLLTEFMQQRRKRYLNRLKKEGRSPKTLPTQNLTKTFKNWDRMYYVYVDEKNELFNFNSLGENFTHSPINVEENTTRSVLETASEIKQDDIELQTADESNLQRENMTKLNKIETGNVDHLSSDDEECSKGFPMGTCKDKKIIRVLDKAVSFYTLHNNEEKFSGKDIDVFVYMPRRKLLVYIKSLCIDDETSKENFS